MTEEFYLLSSYSMCEYESSGSSRSYEGLSLESQRFEFEFKSIKTDSSPSRVLQH